MRIAVVGASGRTGRHIVRAVLEEPAAELVAALELPGHELLGVDAGVVAGVGEAGVALGGDLERAAGSCEVLIDFSHPDAAARSARACARAGSALVVGTTGLGPEAREALAEAAARVPVVVAPNMSVGVNVVLELLARAARMLGPDYDFEIFEMHHRGKLDAPSGTALRMAEVVASERGLDLAAVGLHGRSGAVGPRPRGQIGVLAGRGGDVVGDHLAIFAGPGDRVEITHRASSRDAFAKGAVRAALWAGSSPPGLYDMGDVLRGEDR